MDPDKPSGNETTYVWEIENFSMCPQSKEECLKSTSFFVDSLDLSEYQLVLYPRGGSDQDDTPYCLLECLQDSDFLFNMTMTISHDGSTNEYKGENVELHAGQRVGFRVESFQREKTPTEAVGKFALLTGDLLTVRCTVTPLYRDPQANEEDLKTLSEDLGRMRQTGLFADFRLVAEGQRKFPVHKGILSVRCEQLAKEVGMFDGGEGLMDDVTGEALEVFLNYVYTGRLGENLSSELLNEVYTMADLYGMDDLKRDLFPLELSTVGRTIIKIDHHVITWDLVDFHQRVEWPVQTLLDLVIGRFVASYSLVVDEDTGKIGARVELKCQCLNLDDSLTMKCVVQELVPPVRETLCEGEHRFDTNNLGQPLLMRGDYNNKYRSVEEFPDRVALVFDLKVSHPRSFNQCHKMEVTSALYTPPRPFWKRSLRRLSSDMDLVFKDSIERDNKSRTFTDVKVVIDDSLCTAVPAHRCILSARSGHLKSLIVGNDQTPEIPLNIGCDETLFTFLRYVYSGKLPEELNMQELMGLYRSIGPFQMKSLRSRCLQLFRSKSQLEDLIMLILCSDDLKDDQLMFIAVSLIRKDKDLVLKSKEWAEVMKWSPKRAKMTLKFAKSGMNFPIL